MPLAVELPPCPPLGVLCPPLLVAAVMSGTGCFHERSQPLIVSISGA